MTNALRYWSTLLLLISGLFGHEVIRDRASSPRPIVPRDPVPTNLYKGLVWRNIGPFRAGRVSAVSGAIGQPGTFYAGYPLGGVWKTTSAGITWYPIMDNVMEASSVGAIQVAPSDPNIIYVGMGDLITGGGINEGNGVYKSTDAGATWVHMGLDETKQIPSILVDPKDPNLVLLAAQGDIHTLTHMRGVFRSTDGGRTWKNTLYVDSVTGGQNIAWAFDRPDVILATTVRHYTPPVTGPRLAAPAPGAAGAPPAGGAGRAGVAPPANSTKLFKSTDEGLTWTEISGHGLPTLTGRTMTAIAMHTDAQRMFIEGTFGLYRSDDGGANWRRMAANDPRITSGQGGYNTGVYVDTKNPDIIYTINTSSYRSLDGGNTFTGFKGAPGGDDPQEMWLDPTNADRLYFGFDQGPTISLDHGATWTDWYNTISTAQIYHLSADNSYPYWVYGTQQDAGSIGARSRGDLGAITPWDWFPNPGYEFGSIVADPLNPKVIYAGGPSNGVIKETYPSGQWINISPNIDTALALRKVGNQPLNFNAANPRELLIGFQYMFSTTDGGVHWNRISPDLGYPKGYNPPPRTPPGAGAGGVAAPTNPPINPNPPPNPPATPAQPVPFGGSIESFSTAAIAPAQIWVGTNNGLVKLTRNHGATWEDVSITDLPNSTRADISTIEASPTDPATAYAAVDYHTMGDYKPYFYRTHDYGKTWQLIINGMRNDQPSGSFARVIRADTKTKGLLFAGTESSVYVSFNDGDDWQSLQLNLPNTSYRDMVIKGNDLVVATYGRGFWILDDYSPLRQITAALASEPAHLFAPGDAIRVRRNVNGDTPLPPETPHAINPPLGVVVYYTLASKPAGVITLEVLDATGNVVRHYSSAPVVPYDEPPPPVPNHWLEVRKPMPTDVGMNRINWNMRYDDPPAYSHTYEINANEGETNASPEGPLALPGVYTFRLTVDGKTYTQKASVSNDPRSPATIVDLRAQHDLQMKIYNGIRESYDGHAQAEKMGNAVSAVLASNPPEDVAAAANALQAKITSIGGQAAGRGRGAGGGGGGGGGRGGVGAPPAFTTLVGAFISQLDQQDWGDMAPTPVTLRAWNYGCTNLRNAVNAWHDANTHELVTLNAALVKHGMSQVPAATPSLPSPACATTPPVVVPKK